MKYIFKILFCFLFVNLSAQELLPDDFCITMGDSTIYNVLDNDPFCNMNPNCIVEVVGNPNSCITIRPDGQVIISNNNICCGEDVIITYTVKDLGFNTEAHIEIKCPKPDCSLVDLSDLGSDDPTGGNGGQASCVNACENSGASYYLNHTPGNSYIWAILGGTYTVTGPGAISINWGSQGSGLIQVTIINGTDTTSQEFCVDILEGPTASFISAQSCVCLNSPISFTNTSIGGNSYFWDFGDGTFYSGFSPPAHIYNTAGTFTVTLVATKDNYDVNGNPLCCCTDTFSSEIIVDPKPGPNIYWISTLCEGDTSKYWTDAGGCNYIWSLTDANGFPLSPIVGGNNDTICVVWPTGPYGTVTLQLSGCVPNIWCEKPVSVQVPIIPSVSVVAGPTVVCDNSAHTYTLPKWTSTLYDWNVVGGVIVSVDSTTNTVTILWGNGDTSMDMGTITVNYKSKFLSNLPAHEEDDCEGTAFLKVNIKPKYSIYPTPFTVCKGSTTFVGSDMIAPSGFTWKINPAVAPLPIVGLNSINITWPATGLYTLLVYPNAPNPFCNDTIYRSFNVVSTPALTSITGPATICPGDTVYYTANSLNNSYVNWTISGGMLIGSPNDNPIAVKWDASGVYTISATQTSLLSPYCTSSSISFSPNKKVIIGPLSISGGDTCINSSNIYSIAPIQDPAATYNWSISPPAIGSLNNPSGSAVNIQWNKITGIATLTCNVTLCGITQTVIKTINITAPNAISISQTGVLCPGMSASLTVSGTLTNIMWSNGGTLATTAITSPGTYTVTALSNGCSVSESFTAYNNTEPIADISTPDLTGLCIPSTNSVTLYAMTNLNYSYQWFCNGSPTVTTSSLTHTNTNVIGTFAYHCVVTHIPTGCLKTSNTIVVTQSICPGGGSGGCTPETHSISATNSFPACNQVTFTTNNINVTSWSFGDPLNNTFTGPINNPVHVYSKAGYKIIFASGYVPELGGGPTDSCYVTTNTSVCIPIVANFNYTNVCRAFCFNDLSTVLSGQSITGWSWDFGDGSSLDPNQNPCHTYTMAGSKTVILTATASNGCTSTFSIMINVPVLPDSSFTLFPTAVCQNISSQFNPTNSGYLIYDWDFGDTYTNGAVSPFHSYSVAMSYTVTLTVTDIYGCINTGTQMITVFPNPAPSSITVSPTNEICLGDTATLTAANGYSNYMWSTGETTQSILIAASGVYYVTLTDVNGCKSYPDSVEIIVRPKPMVNISGPHVICDNGCIDLTGSVGLGNTYMWLDAGLNPIPGAVNNILQICQATYTSPVYFVVIDPKGCTDTSAAWIITLETAPLLSILSADTLCAGDLNLLQVSPILSGVNYHWNTGSNATGIIVSQAGTYSVIATDTLTGCKSKASKIVHGVPDLCYVPSGCYKICKPDTLCAPPGLSSYQWNLNGIPIPGETMQTFVVTMNGTYTFTGTNQWGCDATTDSLILETMICCKAGDIVVSAIQVPEEDCCWDISFTNNIDSVFAVKIFSPNGDIDITAGSLDPGFQVVGSTSSSVTIANSTLGSQISPNTYANFITTCFTNITSTPVIVYFNWYDSLNNVICKDTLSFECEPHGDCLYLLEDSIHCDNELMVYEMTVCNPSNASFAVGYLNINTYSPSPGLLPSNIILSPLLLPGQCTTLVFTFPSGTYSNENLCYNIVSHEDDPATMPGALCCNLDTSYCSFIPGCSPCDSAYVYSITNVSVDDDTCCYDIILDNYYDGDTYTGINLCVLSAGNTITLNNAPGSGWNTTLYTGSNINLDYNNGSNNTIPLGHSILPTICIDEASLPITDLEIKWMQGTVSPCRDTVSLLCSDCGQMEYEIVCDNGTWIILATFYNNTNVIVQNAYVSWTDANLTGYNIPINFGSLHPLGSYGPVKIPMGLPAVAGQDICAQVVYHAADGGICCDFKTIINLPECDITTPIKCVCNKAFVKEVNKGILCTFSGTTGTFSPLGLLSENCDKVIWTLNTGESYTTYGNASINHTFMNDQVYELCMTVIRNTGFEECKVKVVKQIEFGNPPNIITSKPNPVLNKLLLEWPVSLEKGATIEVIDQRGRLEMTKMVLEHSNQIELDVSNLHSGLYFLKFKSDKESSILKFIKIE